MEPSKIIFPTSFTFHEDDAHGWLEVPFALLVQLQIDDKITAFSYRNGDTAYLEEDLDYSIFIDAVKRHPDCHFDELGWRMCIKEVYQDESFVRELPGYYR